MRVFAISDIHIDYDENRRWLSDLSKYDYKDDILILAGDVCDKLTLINIAFRILKERFSEVFYVLGNHDLWACHSNEKDSLGKYEMINSISTECGIWMKSRQYDSLSIIPLLGWYDYSFGQPSDELKSMWVDYSACKWPDELNESRITEYFISQNIDGLDREDRFIISFSHFLPRIDIMPSCIPLQKRILYPVLGTSLLDKQIRKIGSKTHIYGHSHFNNEVSIGDTVYINNAFGYPYEKRISMKRLRCVYSE